MARYVLLTDFQYGPITFRTGQTVADEYGDPIQGLLESGAPLVPSTPELESLLSSIPPGRKVDPLAQSAAAVAGYAAGPGRVLLPDANGVVHVYVDGKNGSDSRDGLTPARAFKTITAGWRRLRQWLRLDFPYDCALEIDNPVVNGVAQEQVYDEYVDFRLDAPPQRRVMVRGNRDKMVVVASGTLTAATANLLTDAGAAFGATQQQSRRIVKVWDPADVAGTVQWKTIRSHTGTALTPVEPFLVPPVAGWQYQVLRPGVRVTGSVGAVRGYAPTVMVNLPWGGAGSPQFPGGGPAFLMAWLQVEQFGLGGQNVLQVDGGAAQFAGVVVEGDGFEGATITRCSATLGQVGGNLVYDPLWDLQPLDFGTLFGATLGVRSTGAGGMTGLRCGVGSFVNGSYVFVGVGPDFPIFVQQGYGTFVGGATHSGRVIAGELSNAQFSGGFFGNDIPFLVRNASGTSGLEVRYGSNVIVNAVDFSEITGSAVSASKHSASVEIVGPITKSGAVTQFCLDAQRGGVVQVHDGVAGFAGNAGEIRADAATTTFAALVAGTPLLGANSGPRVWRGS